MNRTRLLLFALVASLAVNLFFVGGIAYRVNRGDAFSDRPIPPNVNWMVRDLSEIRRTELQPLLERSADEIRPVRRALFDAQRQVNELMANPNYDAATLEQAFAVLRTANLRYQEMSHQHSVAMLNELTETERQLAVEFINRRGPRDGRDRRDGDGPRFEGPRGDRSGFPDGPPDGFRPPMPPPANQVPAQ